MFVGAVSWSSFRGGASRETVVRRGLAAAAVVAAWIAITGIAAARGVLHFDAPPTMLLVLVASLALSIGLALSPVGRRIAVGVPVAVLVGYQGFRVIVEL